MYAKTTTMLISAMMLMTVAEDARAAAKVEKDKFKGVQVATQFSIDASVTFSSTTMSDSSNTDITIQKN
jgi:hypothetical protein